MNIVAIGGSNTSDSINRALVDYVVSLLDADRVASYNLSEINLPIYSIDREEEFGIHPIAIEFANSIDQSDLIVISLAENNGSYNVGFKNLMDWTSRIKDRKTWGEKPMLLMATSPGKRGGATVLEVAINYFPRMGAEIISTFSLPSFYDNFDEIRGITNEEIRQDLLEIVDEINSKFSK